LASLVWPFFVEVLLDRAEYGEGDVSSISATEIHARAFQVARVALDQVLIKSGEANTANQATSMMIPPNADSAHATGFHAAGGMSRYNSHREGIVFSDDCTPYSDVFEASTDDCRDFCKSMTAMFHSLHGIADNILKQLEKRLRLPTNWFQRHLGPTTTSSQWHMKRFVEIMDESSNPATVTETGQRILLPMHTDPSLISVVIHDVSPSINDDNSNDDFAPSSMGLQYYDAKQSSWIEVENGGHNIATIFVGSVLTHLTAGRIPAVKHRVVETIFRGPSSHRQRMAATLFVRPQLAARLDPDLFLLSSEGGSAVTESKPVMTFGHWLKKVSKNYEKKKKKSAMTKCAT
jgi:isopenicillin N synthase-like dioxygenase